MARRLPGSWVKLGVVKVVVIGAGLVIGAGGMAGCERSADGQTGGSSGQGSSGGASSGGGSPGARPAGTPVTVAKAELGDVNQYVDEIGTATAVERVSIRAQVGGPLTEVRVRDGQDVKKGDVLFVIDKRPFEAALAEARANWRVSQADLSNAERDLRRLESLPQGAASAQDVDTAKANVERYSAQVAVNEAQIATAELNLSYTDIRSPIDGRMGKVVVTSGNLVTASTQELADIRSIDPIYVDFSTPERNLSAMQAAMERGEVKVTVSIPGEGAVAEGGGYEGLLTFVDNEVMSGLGQVQLRALVTNKGRTLWPGRFVEVRVVTGELKGVVLVPADAVDQGEGGARTYVVKADGTAELRRLRLGQRHRGGDGTERLVVLEGVQAGETVVVKGRWLLGPGAKVRISQ